MGDISSQEEYEESESESDRVMTSSNEGLIIGREHHLRHDQGLVSDDEENRTAVNYPIRSNDPRVFTPQPNAFSHPPQSQNMRHASEPCPGSYFPQMPARNRPMVRHSFSTTCERTHRGPHGPLSPSHSAAAHHEAALRASLSTLLSCAAAARGLTKPRPQPTPAPQPRPSNRVETNTLRLLPESALPGLQAEVRATAEPSFPPTIRHRSSSLTSGSADRNAPEALEVHKRKSARASSKERRATKKARRAPSASSASSSSSTSTSSTVYSADDVLITPTLLTWVVSAGVVVVLSAISFSAGYSIGREAGRVETSSFGVAADLGGCATEAGRSSLGLRRLRFTTQV